MSTVHRALSKSDDCFLAASGVPVGVAVAELVDRLSDSLAIAFSDEFLFCVDHYFLMTFLSSFVILAECLDIRSRISLPFSMLLG